MNLKESLGFKALALLGPLLLLGLPAGCTTQPPTASELQPLQGTWEGVLVGDKAQQKITITITGTSFHFHRDTNFWWKTTIALPADTNPRQLHATIKDCHDCPPEQESSVGKVVVAIFKIEDGTLTLATGNGDGVAPKSFEPTGENGLNRYELRKVQPQKKNAVQPSRPSPQWRATHGKR